MTCRHQRGDPSCSSYNKYLKEQEEKRLADVGRAYEKGKAELELRSPNPDEYEVIEVKAVENNLVMKVRYSGCEQCSFDAMKIMVFLDVDLAAAIKWRRIDPHFDDKPRSDKEAPSPAARFPATDRGWQDALSYAGQYGSITRSE